MVIGIMHMVVGIVIGVGQIINIEIECSVCRISIYHLYFMYNSYPYTIYIIHTAHIEYVAFHTGDALDYYTAKKPIRLTIAKQGKPSGLVSALPSESPSGSTSGLPSGSTSGLPSDSTSSPQIQPSVTRSELDVLSTVLDEACRQYKRGRFTTLQLTTLITTHSFETDATSLIQAANDEGILLQKKGGTDWFVALPADFGVDSSSKKNNCGVCDEPDDHRGMLECAKCLMWFHCVCVGIPIIIKIKHLFRLTSYLT